MQRSLDQLEEAFGTERIMAVLGNGVKELAPAEEANYGRTNRSLHFMRKMNKGEKICEGDIKILRTEKVLSPGISPEFYDSLMGAVLARDVEDGAGVQLEDFLVRS